MELRDYLAMLKPYTWLLVGIPVLFAFIGYIGTVRRPPTFEASTTLTVEKPQAIPQVASNFYQYDEYYSQLAAALFADTIANWLRSPGPVVEVYEQAGLTPPEGGAAEIARTFRVSKGDKTTVITLTVQNREGGNAARIAEAAKSVINRKVDELRVRNNDPNYFSIDMTAAKVFEVSTNPYLIAILGLVTGLVVALVFAFLLAAIRPVRQK